MFRKRDPNGLLFETSSLLTDDKIKRLPKTWAGAFREHALPLIDEEAFRCMYDQANGRPNRSVETLIGVLILKEMFNFTDEVALEQLDFNFLWQHALRLEPDEAHLCQKTLHNFRTRLLFHDGARLAFEQITDGIIKALGIKVTKQRLDSTHIISNMAILTRLGLFCETIRVFLSELRKENPRLYGHVPQGLRRRYIQDNDQSTRYEDAKSSKARRRLEVCGRDVYRLISRFKKKKKAIRLASYDLLVRLFQEQCELLPEAKEGTEGDDDTDEGGVPVKVKAPTDVSADSLQSPHDPDATYSGHKGKGYEVQASETCDKDNIAQVFTHVSVTDACGSDAHETIPIIEDLQKRGLQPDELMADTAYGSADNALDADRLGTEVISPVAGGCPGEAQEKATDDDGEYYSPADFDIDVSYARPTTCPEGHASLKEREFPEQENRVEVHFDKDTCRACPSLNRCPVRFRRADGTFVLHANLRKVNLEKRRRMEASGEFKKRYDIRAGVEASFSEGKRAHGLGRPRVRGKPRVRLATFFKMTACNIKRMLRACLTLREETVPEMA